MKKNVHYTLLCGCCWNHLQFLALVSRSMKCRGKIDISLPQHRHFEHSSLKRHINVIFPHQRYKKRTSLFYTHKYYRALPYILHTMNSSMDSFSRPNCHCVSRTMYTYGEIFSPCVHCGGGGGGLQGRNTTYVLAVLD